MPEFTVPIVEEGNERMWRDYNSDTPSKEARRVGRTGTLGQTVVVTAGNKNEAAAKARQLMPGYTVMAEGIARLG